MNEMKLCYRQRCRKNVYTFNKGISCPVGFVAIHSLQNQIFLETRAAAATLCSMPLVY